MLHLGPAADAARAQAEGGDDLWASADTPENMARPADVAAAMDDDLKGDPMSDLETIGREWLALGGGWADGMLDGRQIQYGERWRFVGRPCGRQLWVWDDGETDHDDDPAAWPDLSDPATEGACMGVLRRLAKTDEIFLIPHRSWADVLHWCVSTTATRIGTGATRPEALVAALRALRNQ